MTTPKDLDAGELRKDIVDVLDQFGFVISSRKYYSSSAEMNGEIVKATDSLLDTIHQFIASKLKEREQAIWQRVGKAIPEKLTIRRPRLLNTDAQWTPPNLEAVSGYNKAIDEFTKALPELQTLKQPQREEGKS